MLGYLSTYVRTNARVLASLCVRQFGRPHIRIIQNICETYWENKHPKSSKQFWRYVKFQPLRWARQFALLVMGQGQNVRRCVSPSLQYVITRQNCSVFARCRAVLLEDEGWRNLPLPKNSSWNALNKAQALFFSGFHRRKWSSKLRLSTRKGGITMWWEPSGLSSMNLLPLSH